MVSSERLLLTGLGVSPGLRAQPPGPHPSRIFVSTDS